MKKRAAAVVLLIIVLLFPKDPAFAAGSFWVYDDDITLTAGQVITLKETEEVVSVTSDDESVAAVDGLKVTARGEGECALTVTFAKGNVHRIDITVIPLSVRRALLMGEADYEGEKYRVGCVNTTQGMTDMFASQKFTGGTCQTVMRMDSSRKEFFELIGETFGEAGVHDVSILYINCHGGIASGVPYLKLHDGSRISAPELERALRKIPGVIVLLIDCCQSGGFLGSGGASGRFNDLFTGAFAAFGENGVFGVNKYKILTSCSLTQNSYRITTETEARETGMATVFARALCEGAGWDLIRDKVCTMKADANLDRTVTLREMYAYLTRRVPHYLKDTQAVQDVRVYPEGDGFVLCAR